MNISHVSLVMTKDSDLIVYKNKGRPTKAETESIEVNGDLTALKLWSYIWDHFL